MKQDVGERIKKTNSQMRKGNLEFCILLVIAEGKVYASDIISKLKEVELIVVEGTLYPLLSRLKTEGLLNYTWEESTSGPPRKYYELTDLGHEVLRGLEETWENINKSINQLIKSKKKI